MSPIQALLPSPRPSPAASAIRSYFRSSIAALVAAAALLGACSGSSKPSPAAPETTSEPIAAGTPPVALTPTPEPSPPLPPAATPSDSRLVTQKLQSAALGVEKSVVVYLPRGYDTEPERRYPVFYYLHGLGGDETNWSKSGKLGEAADQLGLDAIVVMPDGDDSFYVDSRLPIDYDKCMKDGSGLFLPGKQDPATTCVRARKYETYIVKDLVGWVDSTYRTITTREARAIAGLSMGGFGAMELGLRHHELFSAAASHSGAIGLLYAGPRPFVPGKAKLVTSVKGATTKRGSSGAWLKGLFGDDLAGWRQVDVVQLANALPPGRVALYIDCGTEDELGLHDNAQYVHEALTAKEIPHEFFLGPGGHNFAFWSARLPHSLAFLREHTAKAQ
jgi:S-formylglutathione hydrolase FrmB